MLLTSIQWAAIYLILFIAVPMMVSGGWASYWSGSKEGIFEHDSEPQRDTWQPESPRPHKLVRRRILEHYSE
jgi:hypothetical protein